MEIGVFSEGRADGADEVVFCFANVEGAEVDSMLGFRDFVVFPMAYLLKLLNREEVRRYYVAHLWEYFLDIKK